MPGIDPPTLARLLDAHAPFRPLPFVPELRCWHTANEIPLWEALEAAAGSEVPPPFFALAWPAGQALARLVLDGRVPVEGKRVVDVGCGSGAVALAAAMRGATVLAVDVDPLATTACTIAAERLGLRVEVACRDAFEVPDSVDADVVLAADLVYHRSQLAAATLALGRWRESRTVVLADGGRPHFEGLDLAGMGFAVVGEFEVPAERIVEGAESRRVRVFSG